MSEYDDNVWGELVLQESDVAPFPRRREGTHRLENRTAAEYVDDGIPITGSRTVGRDGDPVVARFRAADAFSKE